MSNFIFIRKNRNSYTQLTRYAAVGLASNAVGYTAYLLITYWGAPPKIAMTFLYAVSASIGFWGNRKLTFAHEGKTLGAGFRYLIVHCSGYFINLAILVVLVDKLGYAHQWAQAIAIFVVAAFLFFAIKFFVFKAVTASNMDTL
jgi:putative flippase GtrA